jgi:hypothetical protein
MPPDAAIRKGVEQAAVSNKRSSPDDDPKPQPPVRPAPEDCCHSGCTPCVFDLYDAELERYRAALDAWERRRKSNSRA